MKPTKHISNVSRQTRYARTLREALIVQLGGQCEKQHESPCAGELEFDHKNGRRYIVKKLSYSARLARYKKEADAGELRLLCEKHNKEARVTNDNGQFVPTKDAAEVPRTSHMDFAETEDYSPTQVF